MSLNLGTNFHFCYITLQVLPLLTLNQYFSTFVCRDLQRTVDGRILKTRVLADLGLFTEAFIVLQRLLHGERLPHTGDSSFRQVESKISSFKFNTSKPITEPANLKVSILTIVCDWNFWGIFFFCIFSLTVVLIRSDIRIKKNHGVSFNSRAKRPSYFIRFIKNLHGNKWLKLFHSF